ncbi:MAG TPA: nickel insertion protein, partial [Terriglobales bacterium]|nr:nickel insertion protein [Terriglobales bacterium]
MPTTSDQRLLANDQRLTTVLMRIAYLDCFSGISGDMFLGALVDAGVSPKLLEDTVTALDIGARLEISRVLRGGISATKVDVYANGEKDLPREVFWERQGHDHADSHEHHHHDHEETVWGRGSAPPRTGHSPVPTQHRHEHGRSLTEIRQIIEKAAIGSTAKAIAIRIFEALGEAEAEIHGTSVEQVHFHEVGVVDAMVDIVCA